MRLTQCELLFGRIDLFFYGHVPLTKRGFSVQDACRFCVWVGKLAVILSVQDSCRFCVGCDPSRSSAGKSLISHITYVGMASPKNRKRSKRKKRFWGRSRSFSHHWRVVKKYVGLRSFWTRESSHFGLSLVSSFHSGILWSRPPSSGISKYIRLGSFPSF